MSSASKASKASKTSKETKPIKETKKSDSDSEMEKQDKHSVFNSDINKEPKVAKAYLKLFNGLNNDLLDKDSVDIIINYAYGEPLESLEKLVKDNDSKTKKENKKKETVFEAADLTKPKKAIDIFGAVFYADAKEKGIKFTKENNPLTGRTNAWKALSDKEKEKYEKLATKQKEDYSIQYEKQKAEAIKNGLFREDVLKSPPKDIDIFGILFSKESKDKGVKFSKDNNYLVARKKAWDSLSEKEKEKYISAAAKAKSEYDIKKEKWDENEKLRLEKQSGVPVDIKIESSGNSEKKKPAKSKSAKDVKKIEAPVNSDSEEEEEKIEVVEGSEEEEVVPVVKATKKTSSKKTEEKAAAATDDEVKSSKKTKSKKTEDKTTEDKPVSKKSESKNKKSKKAETSDEEE